MRRTPLHEANRGERDNGNDFNGTENPQFQEQYISAAIGGVLWKLLNRVSIPVFNGNKKNYSNWKADFMGCMDQALPTAEYKLVQLRQYLTGEALNTIENLGHSRAAYQIAKERLKRKFGGYR